MDWGAVAAGLDARGYAVLPGLVAPQECTALTELYEQDSGFRGRVVMARHGYGQGVREAI